MAELNIAPEKDSGNALAVIIALVVLAAIAAAIFYFNPHKISELKVTSADVFSPQTTFGAMEGPSSANGMHVLGSAATTSETDLYVIAHVSMTDKLRLPIYINGAVAHLTLADGTETEASLLSASDLKRLEVIFPALREKAAGTISDGATIEPEQNLRGTILFSFPGQTADNWHNRKSAVLTIQLRNQGPQTTTIP